MAKQQDRFGMVPRTLLLGLAQLKGSATKVYLALATYRNKETELAWPSTETVAKDLGLSESAVKRGLRELKEAGFLIKDGLGPFRTTRYRMPWKVPAARKEVEPDRVASAPPGVQTRTPGGVNPEPPERVNPDPQTNHLTKKSKQITEEVRLEARAIWNDLAWFGGSSSREREEKALESLVPYLQAGFKSEDVQALFDLAVESGEESSGLYAHNKMLAVLARPDSQ